MGLSESRLFRLSEISGTRLCLGLLLISGTRERGGSTGETAILARRPGLTAPEAEPDRGARVCGEEAALREARRRRDDVLRCNMLSTGAR